MKLQDIIWFLMLILPGVVIAQEATDTPDGGLPRSEAGQLLFVQYDDIYVIDGDGSNERNLTNSEEAEQTPVWSSDGSQIIFAYERSLFQMNADGSNRQHLIDSNVETGFSTYLLASPNGNYLLWSIATSVVTDAPRYFIVDLANESLQPIASQYSFLMPSWSTDGEELVFSDLGAFPTEVTILNIATGEERYLFQGYQPMWSPDGNSVAFITFIDFGITRLNFITLETSNLVQLTDDEIDIRHLAWSPDSTKIAYVAGEHTEEQPLELVNMFIATVDIATRHIEIVTDEIQNIMSLAWSSDGSRIAFMTRDESGTNLYTVDSTGENLQRIHEGMTYFDYAAPAWRP